VDPAARCIHCNTNKAYKKIPNSAKLIVLVYNTITYKNGFSNQEIKVPKRNREKKVQ